MTDRNREETPDIVAQVRAALEGITPLPWQVLRGVPPDGREDEHFVGDAAAVALSDFRGAMDNAQDAQAIVTVMNAAPQLLALIEEMRKSKSALHRRAQAAEGALLKANRLQPVDTWSSVERQQEAKERDRMMDAVGKAGSR